MKIKFKKGYQNKLILSAKQNKKWSELAKKLNISTNYLSNDLRREKVLISQELYEKLCKISKLNYDTNIIKKLEDNWGKSLGGKNSNGSLIKIIEPKKDEKLAEFIGAILGDGNINYYKKGNKIGVYQIKIAGDFKLDKDYHLNYLKPLGKKIFNLKIKEIHHAQNNERFLVIYSKQLIEFLMSLGLLPGDKIKNQTTIPSWIKENNNYLKTCIRGLFDTDGSIFKMSKRDSNLLRIGFTNYNLTLILDVKNALENMGFKINFSKDKKHIYLSRKADVERYLKEIGFSNSKHLCRLELFRLNNR